jgi:rubredoxin
MDADALKKTNPYKGEGFGLGGDTIGLADAFLAAFNPSDDRAQPFTESVRKSMDELPTRLAAATRQSAARGASPGSAPPEKAGIDWYNDPEKLWRNIDDAWLGMGERLALQLDNATNNTSLVLAFEFEDSKDVLLFVGDAQAGNWRSWDSCKWTVKEKDGERRKVTAADLLQRTVFYKVGHHGSHNATMREKGLERMTSRNLAAVIPVDTEVAHKVKGWEDMPLPAIRQRLEEKCAVVFQSDMPPKKLREVPGTRWEESQEKFNVRMKDKAAKTVKTVRKQSLYTDYFL